ncbi:FliI/YscN family ATPase [Paraferrimonas sp. SM1919]|uniref:FliI/YscN family ATPase n=1 Tax=Paraferrimonas sp. SM1919 TaxID=2662263 RepID=UPI0013CF4895|nr:FliI/YscN family ATPase [Paraferrimonas sp. SM1919]
MNVRTEKLISALSKRPKLKPINIPSSGVLLRVVGLTLEAKGVNAALGAQCSIEYQGQITLAEIVGFDQQLVYLMPLQQISRLAPGAKVTPIDALQSLPFSEQLLGRILAGNGEFIDELPVPEHIDLSYQPQQVNPLSRQPVEQALDVGIRSINSLLTVGKGQRMGLFAGSGVGKSVLLGMMTKGTAAEVIVVGLVGERGREVREFIDEILGPEARKKAVVVVAPADASPLMRLRACETATAIAEYFRDKGKDTLLLLDSLTRYAQAQREIALAIGEPPATKGYPPSVFAKLPALVERAGNSTNEQGSLTAFYTVLTEGDDPQDPIADAARAILDGHIMLSRDLAESGHYPAIDIESSISRVMPSIVSAEQLKQSLKVKKSYSLYQQNKELIAIGAYQQGSEPNIDKAILIQPTLTAFLQQSMNEKINITDSQMLLAEVAQQCPELN